jgi:Domain of unknown function (DUF6767)
MCPLRPGEPCTLCQVDVTGPQDCGLVYLVMGDDELREGLRRTKIASTSRYPPRQTVPDRAGYEKLS